MRKKAYRILLSAAIFSAIVPLTGFPGNIKDALSVILGVVLAVGIFLLRRRGAFDDVSPARRAALDSFVESAPSEPAVPAAEKSMTEGGAAEEKNAAMETLKEEKSADSGEESALRPEKEGEK